MIHSVSRIYRTREHGMHRGRSLRSTAETWSFFFLTTGHVLQPRVAIGALGMHNGPVAEPIAYFVHNGPTL